ncbi:MAG: peptidoglycan bridge formation glycyltransferase FemA/FemB family protein [Nanoarchaeota archaeon]|nr:peptidoglycan bridge formation glycyltransferase FemA/FemB family protein [Nanoarchaeota archaeon]
MEKSFLQSDEWVDFQKRIGRDILQIDGINIIEHALPTGKTYFYAPRTILPENLDDFLSKLKKIARQRNAIFFKTEPAYRQAGPSDLFNLKSYGFVESNNIQPIRTIILDLSKSEQELLNQMHPKMRYNIGLAKKKGIIIRRGSNNYDFDEFWKLMQQTSKRDGFNHYSRAYYEEMLTTTGIELFLAEHKNEVVVANIMVLYKNTATYLHGASSYEYRNLMAAPLLQWYQILEAKKLGCTEYDFWGIDEIKWPGVTRFKRGFGGKEVTYPGAYDLVFKPFWYKIYKLAKRIL